MYLNNSETQQLSFYVGWRLTVDVFKSVWDITLTLIINSWRLTVDVFKFSFCPPFKYS